MTMIHYMKQSTGKELIRAYHSEKAYLYFDIGVFNAGLVVNIKCTDEYKEINQNTWNGYDFIIENDDTTKFYIAKVLEEFLEKEKPKFSSESQKRRAKKIIKNL